jgi:hypothetical protein
MAHAQFGKNFVSLLAKQVTTFTIFAPRCFATQPMNRWLSLPFLAACSAPEAPEN